MNESLKQLTLDLVRIKTTADRPDELVRSIEYVNAYFAGTTHFVKRFESGGKPSIVISTHDTLEPDVILLGHLDVVPALDALFEPRVDGSILYGRGVCDMKAECAVMMQIMKELEPQEQKPNIALILTTDEEVGGVNGAQYLIETIGYRCKVALEEGADEVDEEGIVVLADVNEVHCELLGRRGLMRSG